MLNNTHSCSIPYRALVCVKRVLDYRSNVQVNSDGSGIKTEDAKMSVNPFDEIALEAAEKLKSRGVLREIIAVSIGPKAAEESLRVALARGTDRGILITAPENSKLSSSFKVF